MEEKSLLKYRKCVGMMIINKEKKILVGRRIDHPSGFWQMPQGGIENGESPRNAGLREMKEEIGSNNVKLIGEIDNWLNYDIPQKLSSKLWNGKYRGQTQKWLAFRFLGNDEEINIDTEDPEFKEWKWEEHKNLVNLAVPFKKDIYKKIINEFSHLFN